MSDSKMPTKIFYINQSNGRVGSYPIIDVKQTKQANGKVEYQFIFEAPAKSKGKLEFYLDENEWIEDVKKL